MRSLALRLREDQPRGWAEGCSRLGLVLAGAIGVVLMLGIVAFAYLVPWLLFTSLANVLAGPDRAVVRPC